jgi:hypothetical protein
MTGERADVMWSDPATQNYVRQIGRARGKDIVQERRAVSAIVRHDIAEFTSRFNGQYAT